MQEIVSAISDDLGTGLPSTRRDIEIRLNEFKALIAEAQEGVLDEENWVPVRRNPDLWELRWRWDGTRIAARGYFHEPTVLFFETILAKVHTKDVSSGHKSTIAKLQNEAMDEAGKRVIDGRDTKWGVAWSQPLIA